MECIILVMIDASRVLIRRNLSTFIYQNQIGREICLYYVCLYLSVNITTMIQQFEINIS